MRKLIVAEDPDVVFTQWPIDTHPDHQAASILAFRAWLAARGRFELYYYEVDLRRADDGLSSHRLRRRERRAGKEESRAVRA